MPHATHPSPGLQALILCGPGVSLNTFTSNPKELPKALVPIANRPMIWYPLDWCYRMGVYDITLITPSDSREVLESALKTNPSLTSLPSPKPEILAPQDLTLTTGTAELLRLPEVQKAITRDFVILPCDLISELEGSKIIQQWLTLNPLSLSSGSQTHQTGLAVFYPTQGLLGISTKKDETDFLASIPLPTPTVPPSEGSLRSNIEQIVLNIPTDTLKDLVEEDKDSSLKLRQALVTKHGRLKVKTKHRDAHVYIFPKWVKTYSSENPTFDSISEDLLCWWAKATWQDGLSSKLSFDKVFGQSDNNKLTEDSEEHDEQIDLSTLSSTATSKVPDDGSSTSKTFASRVGDSKSSSDKTTQPPPLYAYVQPSLPPVSAELAKSTTVTPPLTQPLIRRIDTGMALLSVSLYLARQTAPHPLSHEHKVHPTAQVGQQSRISQEDSLVGENVTIGMRANVKESVIGANCEIGANARLTRCLLMDGVVVGDGVQLTGCIVGKRARIDGSRPEAMAVENREGSEVPEKGKGKKKAADDDDEKTRLTDCEVAPGFVVEAGTQTKGEKMMAFDTEEELYAVEDDEEDEDDQDNL